MSSFFGGGSSSSSSSSTPSPSPFDTNISTTAKSRITSQIQTESAMSNAKALIAKVNENCFANCIPSPGTSLSSKEQGCLSACMEKYIEGWNVTSKVYLGRLGRDAQAGTLGQGSAGGSGLLS